MVVASHGLPGASALPRLDDDASELDLIRAAEREQLLGPLHDLVATGALRMSDKASELLASRHLATMQWCLQVECRLLEVHEWFEQVGKVEYLVTKGPAAAHLDSEDPALRSFADLDLLVSSTDIDRVVALLGARGATRPWPEIRPGFDRRFAKSVTMTCTDGVEIDVHRTLCDGPHGVRIPLDRLFAGGAPFVLGGQRFVAPGRLHRMLHAAYHAVLGSPAPRLASLRDIASFMCAEGLDPTSVVPEARRWGGEAVLAAAVRETTARLTFSSPEWEHWMRAFQIDSAELRLIARQRRNGSSFGRSRVDMWRALDDVGQKVAFTHAVLWPTTEHLSARGRRRGVLLRELFLRRR